MPRWRHDHYCRPEASHHQGQDSIADFKLREGNPIGVNVTLRGERMWSFLDRLMNVALPRQRDFRGCLARFLRRARQLQPGSAGTARLARDPVRQDRQGARHGDHHRHQRANRRRRPPAAAAHGHAVPAAVGGYVAKTSMIAVASSVASSSARAQPLQDLWPPARLHAPVRPVPHLFPRSGAEGQSARRGEVELVNS